jgi:uncharacterized protein
MPGGTVRARSGPAAGRWRALRWWWRALPRSRAALWGVSGLLVAGLLALWLVPPDGPPYPRGRVTFATGTPHGVYQRYGKLLQHDIQHDMPGVHVQLVRSEGSVQNVRSVAVGRTMFTIAAADAVADYPGPRSADLRACARLYDDYVLLVVPEHRGPRAVERLRGLRVGVGQTDSGVHLLATRLLRAAGLDPDHDIRAVPVGIDKAPRMLRHGELDAFFWSGGLPTPSITALSQQFPVRLLELGHLVGRLRSRATNSGRYYRQSTMPADAYPAAYPHGRPVSTVAVANLLITTRRTDDALVERLTRTVIRSRDHIGRKVHAAQQLDLRTAIYTEPLPLHDGARRYYRSVKP